MKNVTLQPPEDTVAYWKKRAIQAESQLSRNKEASRQRQAECRRRKKEDKDGSR